MSNLRLDELIDIVNDNTPTNEPLLQEFLEISDLIEKYEVLHFPLSLSTIQEMIELRIYVMVL